MINVTDCLQEIISHICRNVEIFSHVDPDRVLVCFAKARKQTLHGAYAKIYPTRFVGGKQSIERRGHKFALPTIVVGSRPILYVLYFYYPRFQNLRFETKLLTVFHELYHISLGFDGDIRRFPGKGSVHGGSKEEYDDRLKVEVDAYLAKFGKEEFLDFLRDDFRKLTDRFGYVVGETMKMPRAFGVV